LNGEVNVIELIEKGGIAMYPIILCSIVALAIFFERLWVLRRKRIIPADFIRNVEDLLGKQKMPEAISLSQGEPSSIGKIFYAGLKNAGKGMWLVKEAIEERGDREAQILERHLGILSTIVTLSPLLGLMGTVSGMIRCFNVISQQGTNDPAQLAGGIAEVLVATAAGLLVAIPSVAAHRYLKDKADSLIFEMEEDSIKLIENMEKFGAQS
jgi:biopolymer transport protein ExbB